MPKRRDQIQMTEDEMWAFVDGQKTVQVATINRDGTPHLVPLWFAVVDQQVVLETFAKSQKVRNLERDPRLTVLFESGLVYNELRGVSIKGRAELVRDFDRVHELSMAVMLRSTPELPKEVLEKASRSMAAKKVAIVLTADRVMSWDHGKLGGIY